MTLKKYEGDEYLVDQILLKLEAAKELAIQLLNFELADELRELIIKWREKLE